MPAPLTGIFAASGRLFRPLPLRLWLPLPGNDLLFFLPETESFLARNFCPAFSILFFDEFFLMAFLEISPRQARSPRLLAEMKPGKTCPLCVLSPRLPRP